MLKERCLIAFCIVCSFLVSGCASSRMLTDLKPAKNAELKSPAGTFYVADLKFNLVLDNPSPQTTETYKEYQRKLLPLLKKECVERYPALFANDAASSIPLTLTAETTSTSHDFKTKCWLLGTLLISGVILPCPGQTDEDITLKAGIWTGKEERQVTVLEKKFRREIHMWISLLTPAALITIPGESDIPKVSETLLDIPQIERSYLQLLASQIATALAETIAIKDPEFWTSQPRMNSPTIFSPTTLPVTPPVALPLPTDSVAPF
jgi:hypothetical protein